MGKQPKPRRCPGCGCVLQSQDPLQVGYRPPLVNAELEGHSADSLICQRCYNLRFHNRLSPIRVPYQELKEHLHIIKQVRALVVKIVDVFDFSGSFIEDFGKVVGANPVILVANKSDLLPKGMKEERVLSWVKSTAADELRLGNLRAVHLVSAKTGQGIDELSRAIERMRRGRDVFVLGCTNVGKSTLMNRLITKSAKGPSAKTITTSPLPGTTLNLIGFPLGTWNPKKLKKRQLRKAKIYDTPGIINDHQMANYLKASELRFTTPSKRIKPKLYRLVPGKTLFFGGLGRIDYIQGPESMIFSVFMSHKLPIHPTAAEKADEVYRTQLGLRLYPPFRFSSSAESENDELEHQQGERMGSKKTMQKADTAEVERVKVGGGGIATEEKEKATEVIRYSFGDEFLEEELEPLDVTSWNDEIQRDIKLPPLKPHELIIPRKDLNEGWGKAFLDVVFSGLGWVSLTGPKYRPDFDEEDVKLVVHLPEGTGLFIREPLMPFEATATHHIKRHGRILRRRQEENEQEEEGEERPNDTKQEEGDEQEKEGDDNENQKEEDEEANKRKEEGESFEKREKRLKQKKNKKARFKDKYNRLVEKNKGKGFLTKILAQRKVKESRLTNERPDFKPLPPSSS
ncbi:Ribosome biogenesis GTPase YqeH [Balamuthia mandrillaris]